MKEGYTEPKERTVRIVEREYLLPEHLCEPGASALGFVLPGWISGGPAWFDDYRRVWHIPMWRPLPDNDNDHPAGLAPSLPGRA